MSSFDVKGELNNYGFCIKKKKYDKSLIKQIKNYFTVKKEIGDRFIKIIKYPLYYEIDKFLVIPKFFSIKNIDIDEIQIDDIKYNKIQFITKKLNYQYDTVKFNFKGKMRDYQQECIDFVKNLFNNDEKTPKGGLLKFSCGMGKTLMAIYLSYILGVKTLIIVHLGDLLDQWIERIKFFTDATIGVIRQNKLELDKDITIGMVQTICSRDYNHETFKNFGLVILDEVHHYGSQYFGNILMKTSFKYTIGLSATPVREDKMMYVINWFLGEIIYQMKKKFDYKILVKRIHFKSNNPLFSEKLRKYKGKMTPDTVKMLGDLIQIETRNKLIINIINSLKQKGRKIFVFSDRVEHLKTLKEATDKIIEDNDEHHMYKTNYYMGSCKKLERKEAEKNGDIIFATLKIAEEGIDISRLDTVIYALPIKLHKRLEQSSGRILRLEKYDDLINIPLVIDIADDLSCFQGWTRTRNTYFKKEDWLVQNYYFEDDKYLFNDKDDKTQDPFKLIFNNIDDDDFIEKNLIRNNETNNKKIEDKPKEEKPIDAMTLLYGRKK